MLVEGEGEGAAAASAAAAAAVAAAPPHQPVALALLPLTKAAQAQHGLRHNDYQRYRRYCTRRLRRVRAAADFKQGRHRYLKRRDRIRPAQVRDARFLHLLLLLRPSGRGRTRRS